VWVLRYSLQSFPDELEGGAAEEAADVYDPVSVGGEVGGVLEEDGVDLRCPCFVLLLLLLC